MSQSSYARDLDRNPANFQPLTPLQFLERAAAVFPDRCAIVHGSMRRSYADFFSRSRRLASALARAGIGRGDTVAVLLANTPAMLECHYGVPMCGAVLNTLNTRLDAATIAFSLDHGEAKALICDREFAGLARAALGLAKARPLSSTTTIRSSKGRARRSGRWTTRPSSPAATRTSLGRGPPTNGTPSRSTTPPARPATPRAWSIIIAAPTCWRSATC